MTTADAYTWTREDGLQKGGLKCEGVATSRTRLRAPKSKIYDVLVVGAGYAGLSAARDLANMKHSILLLESRDRIGGRTFTVNIEGFNYEMGGTWVSHYQPHVHAELRRYGLDKALISTKQHGYEKDYYSLTIAGQRKQISHQQATALFENAWNKFINIDGELCHKICPLPYQQLGNVMVSRKEVEEMDKLSCWDRYEQIKSELTTDESTMLLAQLSMIFGGKLTESSLWDMIRIQALGGHDIGNFEDIWLTYKLRDGQSHLARRIFDESVGNDLDYSFQTPVKAIKTSFGSREPVEVEAENGDVFLAHRVICTVPLNVLKDIQFSPPLTVKRQEAIDQGHICFMTKIHAEVKGTSLTSGQGMVYPNNLLFGFGDGITPRGNSHVTSFGGRDFSHYDPEQDLDKIQEALQILHPMEIQRLVFHNWNTDRFSQGGPCWWAPGYMTKYQEELQSRHGNIFFASADWADGWRAFIDGALEQGWKSAQEVAEELRILNTPTAKI